MDSKQEGTTEGKFLEREKARKWLSGLKDSTKRLIFQPLKCFRKKIADILFPLFSKSLAIYFFISPFFTIFMYINQIISNFIPDSNISPIFISHLVGQFLFLYII